MEVAKSLITNREGIKLRVRWRWGVVGGAKVVME